MKANEIKAIETEYNGYRFRSRLEARWAVFFDTLGIRYEYEPEGYVLSDGGKYLPDFYLPDYKYYAEVKGMSDHLVEDIYKLKRFVLEAKTAAIILSDVPYDPAAKGLFWFPIQYFSARCRGCIEEYSAFFCKTKGGSVILNEMYPEPMIGPGVYNLLMTLPILNDKENEKYMFTSIQAKSGSKLDSNAGGKPIKETMEDGLRPVEMALKAAREARFEYGETPTPMKKMK